METARKSKKRKSNFLDFSFKDLAKKWFLGVQSYKETSLSIERGGKGVFSKMNKVIQTMFNLSLTPRWVVHITTFKDTTATHSYRVSVLTLIAALIKKEKYGININIEKAVLKALFHDLDRKSTRLNSSHVASSYAVFCLKKTTTKR